MKSSKASNKKAEQTEKFQMEKTIRCNFCDKICVSESFLNSHIKVKHESLKKKVDYECEKCGERFCKKQSLTEHEAEIHSNKIRQWIHM